jgi:cytidine deaminase
MLNKVNPEMVQELIQRAIEARRWAYAAYSNYAVGAALLTASGRIYDGINVENAVSNLGICAERVAVFKAVSEGESSFNAVAVVSSNGAFPCGACRQVLSEFGLETWVIVANENGAMVSQCQLLDLLPNAFGPGDLK